MFWAFTLLHVALVGRSSRDRLSRSIGAPPTSRREERPCPCPFEVLLDKYHPRVIAMEAFEDGDAKRQGRIRKLCRGMVSRAEARGITVRLYSRAQIRKTFAVEKAATREQIAAAVAERIIVLKPRLPKPRKISIGENPNIALFQAAACALTYLMGGKS